MGSEEHQQNEVAVEQSQRQTVLELGTDPSGHVSILPCQVLKSPKGKKPIQVVFIHIYNLKDS